MKRLFLLSAILFYSTNGLTYDVKKPLWKQVDTLSCEKTLTVACAAILESGERSGYSKESSCIYMEKFSESSVTRFVEFRFRSNEMVHVKNEFKENITAYSFEPVNDTFSINAIFVGQAAFEFWRTELGIFKAKRFYSLVDKDKWFDTRYDEFLCIDK